MERGGVKPIFTITEIWKGYKEGQLKNMIMDENESVPREFGDKFVEEVKVLARRKCRDDNKRM